MLRVLLVGAGGFLGAILRYLVGGWVHNVLDHAWFPYGTLVVNVVGCLLIGFLAGLAENRLVFGAETRLFLFIGILGGFTTFSSFAYETLALARDAQNLAAVINVLAQVSLGLAGVWIGNTLSRLM
ncbi:MAG: fluoride efflux transporter CrcB [Candidatus Binatia bacterium]